MQKQKPDVIMLKAKEIFLGEVKEKLPQAQKAVNILRAQREGEYPETIKELYRIAHTLKGSGQIVGLWDIADPAAEMAAVLTLVQEYGVEIDERILTYFDERLFEIKQCLTAYESKKFKKQQHQEEIPKERKQILLVDDDPAITGIVKEYLEKEGILVSACQDTITAEALLNEQKPDLIILDVVLPMESGIEFCRRIRLNHRYQFVPIIFLTIKKELIDRLAGFATGADDYICKPFQMEELAARIWTIINRAAANSELILQDELTKVYNRRYFQQRLEEEIARIERAGGVFSIAMLDIDNFKDINDTYGHPVGDEVLIKYVERIRSGLRTSDNICRFGGDEFVVIMPNTNQREARAAMERLEKLISMSPLECKKNKRTILVTSSIGLATYPFNGGNPEQLINCADQNLYYKKQMKRNDLIS